MSLYGSEVSLATAATLKRELKMPPREGPLPGSARRLRVPTQASYRKLILALRNKLTLATLRWIETTASLSDLEAWWAGLLAEGHTLGGVLGRQRAGDLLDRGMLDDMVGQMAMRTESAFLRRFIGDIADGRYTHDGIEDAKAIQDRLMMYAGKVRATANSTFVGTSGFSELFDWVMLMPEHCDVCPDRAAHGPYSKIALPSLPGDGQTPCMTNCGCVLVRDSDNRIGFARVFAEPPPLNADDIGSEFDPDSPHAFSLL